MSANMTSFFEELVRAKQAIDELPTVQAKLDVAESEKRFLSEKLYDHGTTIDKHLATIQDLRSQISKLEASLDAANKSKGDVDDKLRLLVSIMHSVAADASEAVALIEPKAEPAVSVQSDPTEAATTLSSMASSQDVGQQVVDPLPLGSSAPVEVGQSADPFTTTRKQEDGTDPFAGPSARTTGGAISPSSGQSEANPTVGGSMTTTTVQQEVGLDTGNAEVSSNTPGSGPFASSMEGRSQNAAATPSTLASMETGSSPTVETVASVVSPPKPYQGQAYWRKPDHLTWRAWEDLGGEAPHWLDTSLDLSPI